MASTGLYVEGYGYRVIKRCRLIIVRRIRGIATCFNRDNEKGKVHDSLHTAAERVTLDHS